MPKIKQNMHFGDVFGHNTKKAGAVLGRLGYFNFMPVA